MGNTSSSARWTRLASHAGSRWSRLPAASAKWLTSPPPGSVGDSHPAFSPDGRSIAFVRETGSENGLYLLGLPDGEPRRLTTTPSRIRRPAWTSDGQSLIFTAFRGGSRNALWRVSVHGGEPEPLTGTGEGAGDPSTARLGDRLVFVQSLEDRNLYRADLDGAAGSLTRLAATTRQDVSPDISPDGSRIAFVSDRAGDAEIWVTDVSGKNGVPITDLKTPGHPRWSPDGRHIAFSAKVPGASHSDIHVVDATSRIALRLTFEASLDQWPTWSADGRWIYFMSDRSGVREIWRVSAGGGRAEQVHYWRRAEGMGIARRPFCLLLDRAACTCDLAPGDRPRRPGACLPTARLDRVGQRMGPCRQWNLLGQRETFVSHGHRVLQPCDGS